MPDDNLDSCVRCGAALRLIGVPRFRIGGSSGRLKLLMGELAELGEERLELELLACPRCRRIELRVPASD